MLTLADVRGAFRFGKRGSQARSLIYRILEGWDGTVTSSPPVDTLPRLHGLGDIDDMLELVPGRISLSILS